MAAVLFNVFISYDKISPQSKGGRVPQAPPPPVGFSSFYRTITKLSIWHFERSFNVPRPSHTILAQNHSMLLYSFPQIFLFLNCI